MIGYKGWQIPEGVVTQIAKDGVVLWSAIKSIEDRAVLTVAKQTSNTYAGETSYENESFILLDIYPRKNGTVKVTYGNLTKTITDTSGAEEPNAQQVFFGTFHGVTDSVETPASGTLTIEGNFYAYGRGSFAYSSKVNNVCACITGATELGEFITIITDETFKDCTSLTLTSLPNGITSIGARAFEGCENISISVIPEGVTTIGDSAFYMYSDDRGVLTKMSEVVLPSTIQSIGDYAFGITTSFGIQTIGNYKLTILATTPPNVGEKSLSNKIIVPAGCGEIYKTAEGWSEYADYIVEAS